MNHPDPPARFFNSDARPGFGKALGDAYTKWSNDNPHHSREAGQAKYRELADALAQNFPTWREIVAAEGETIACRPRK